MGYGAHQCRALFAEARLDSMAVRLEELWNILDSMGVDKDWLLSRSLLSPATCCLVNSDSTRTVEEAFRMIRGLSSRLRQVHGLE